MSLLLDNSCILQSVLEKTVLQRSQMGKRGPIPYIRVVCVFTAAVFTFQRFRIDAFESQCNTISKIKNVPMHFMRRTKVNLVRLP